MRIIYWYLVLLSLIFDVSISIAADKVPRDEFIKYTDVCLDIIDEAEVLYSKLRVSVRSTREINDKYETCLKKFKRYGDDRTWDRTLQADIVNELIKIGFNIDLYYRYAERDELDSKDAIGNKEDLKTKVDNVRELLIKYKEPPKAEEALAKKKKKSKK